MKNKDGFTLIELLAVIIILGILMIIAIPSVTTYINNSRKSAYVDTAKEIISGARNIVNEGKLGMYDTGVTYYIPASQIKTEGGEAKSPYGNLDEAYVGVTYDGTGYKYYWTSRDDTGQGFGEMYSNDQLNEDDVKSDIEDSYVDDLVKKTSVGYRFKIKILNENGSWDDYFPETFVIDESVFTEENMCPGCIYLRTLSEIKENTVLTIQGVNDYKQLSDYSTKPFLGVNVNSNNIVTSIKVCQYFNNKFLCQELDKTDSSKDSNVLDSYIRYIKSVYMNFYNLDKEYEPATSSELNTNKDGCLVVGYWFNGLDVGGKKSFCLTDIIDTTYYSGYLMTARLYDYSCFVQHDKNATYNKAKCIEW